MCIKTLNVLSPVRMWTVIRATSIVKLIVVSNAESALRTDLKQSWHFDLMLVYRAADPQMGRDPQFKNPWAKWTYRIFFPLACERYL